MSAISGTVGGILGRRSQKEANAANLAQAKADRELAYQMFQEGKGSTGHAFLPMYFGDNYERELAEKAKQHVAQVQALGGTATDQYNKYKDLLGQYKPMQAAAQGALGDVFSGNYGTQRLKYLEPVQAARTGLAQGQVQAVQQSVAERINALNAQKARAGFTRTGSFEQNRLLGATIDARQAAANALGGATLQNAMDAREVQDQAMAMKLQMMNQPYQMATQALNMEMLPLQQVQANFTRSLQPFEFFRMSPSSFRPEPLPKVEAVPSIGQIAATGIGEANKAIANYFVQQGAQKQYNDQYGKMLAAQYPGYGNYDYSSWLAEQEGF